MTNVWFIRYGESEANAGLSTILPSTVPLTDLGWKQARQVSVAFERAPSLFVTSSYLRAIQTAQPTIERFPSAPVESWKIHEFTYLSPEKLGKTSKSDRQSRVKTFWETSDLMYSDGKDAELFYEFMNRIKTMREKLVQQSLSS